MLELASYVGLGAVAVWAYVCYPKLRPASLVSAVVHVAVSFCAFASMPLVLGAILPLAPPAAHAPFVLVLLIPTLTYVLLSWVWLLARVLHDVSGGPRGGRPVASDR